jgi:hypothetical protein
MLQLLRSWHPRGGNRKLHGCAGNGAYSIIFRISLAVLAVCLASCGGPRLTQFKRFADAGTAYADAVAVVTSEAGERAIDKNSTLLTITRPSLSPDERGEAILRHNELLKERIALLSDVRKHARLLRRYFESLAQLAETDAPQEAAASAESVVLSLGEISDRIKGTTVAGQPVSSFTRKATRLAVAKFKESALQRELQAHAATLERELDLQRAALEAIGNQMQADMEEHMGLMETESVVLPYAAETDRLPSGWANRRKEILTTDLDIASLEAAIAAAENLRSSFVALVEGRLETSRFDALLSDASEILRLIEVTETD